GKQLIEKVSETIESLPPECRKIFKLSREEGLSHSEIADRLAISPRTVENQVSKALKAVRKAAALCLILNL
ncbi:MAG: sigma-70 family RNA polymerase sigma factor, partial [Chitinophagaceae bacterium]|nr:sigma-70 family RNA polymerase sigma factor [Chitinophagaceae bacterium]